MTLLNILTELEDSDNREKVARNETERLKAELLDFLTRRKVKFTIGETVRVTYQVNFAGEQTVTPVSLIPNIDYVLDPEGRITSRAGIVLDIHNIPDTIDFITLVNAIKHAY